MTEFLKENEDLSNALDNLISYYRTEGRERLKKFRAMIDQSKQLVFSGMGTSEFTPKLIEHRLADNGIMSKCADAGELLHYENFLKIDNRLFIFTSQSGETVEIKRLIKTLPSEKSFIAITNCESSTLAKNACLTLPLCAGEEQSITTKTFTNNLALLHIIAELVINPENFDATLDDIAKVSDTFQSINWKNIHSAALNLLPADAIIFIARGPAIVNAKQCALTYMEGARCNASAFTGGSFNHGPFESVDKSSRLVVFAPSGQTCQLIDNLLHRLALLKAKTVVITDRNISSALYPSSFQILKIRVNNNRYSEYLFPIASARTHNLLLHGVAECRGLQAGTFRYGRKVTTNE